jgi:uncharacterized membrane protein (DUF2068 family)
MRLIALFKLLKASGLIVVGVVSLKLIHSNVANALGHWIATLGLAPGNRYADYALQRAAGVSPGEIKDLGLGSLVYASLFLIQGIGLMLLKRWAEWFTVVITSSLVPLEVFDLYRHPTLIKGLILVVNVAVVAYLLQRIRSEHSNLR